ncbi:MAG: 2-oxoglutarate dehydrogenase E1 component [Crocinitomicaceae bacterium]|nr:2-oxoglutarate dehydrogenase E1 component [Crocinitomicaceae bacterium]
MDLHSHLSNADPAAIEALYRQFLADPNSVDPTWRHFFLGFDFAQRVYGEDALESGSTSGSAHGGAVAPKEFRVINLIHAYRTRGHLFTKTNPVRARRDYSPDLSITHFGLDEADLDSVFEAGSEVGIGAASLRDIIAHLQETYCHSIGIEYMYIREPERWEWFKDHIELANRPVLSEAEKKQIFKKLNQATVFEEFLQKKFVGQKRFSVEGGESLLPALDAIVERGSELGAVEFIIGMAHRGRLNTLAHILNKPYTDIFEEFAGKAYDHGEDFDGDVKYHMGYSTDFEADTGVPIHITLAPNPSHLEAVDPVVEGMARARIDREYKDEKAVVPILVHGDAALAGQGVVYEVVQMAQLDGYRTGGTIHLVVNNQVGFTTNYLDARSSIYCTDVAKATHCPVFHVNADDAEAVVTAVRIALEYRQRWHRDVFIDLLGFRKYGHNEGDEPKFTQPKLYKAIQQHPNARELYLQQLESEGLMNRTDAEAMRAVVEAKLDKAMEAAKASEKIHVTNFLDGLWQDYRVKQPGDDAMEVWTGFDRDRLGRIADTLCSLPEDKKYFRKVMKLFKDRQAMVQGDRLDWGLGELLAYGTLLVEGHPVRVSGQDVERGTFSHRHAIVKTEDTEEERIPLNHLEEGQETLTIYNSHLSEYGVMGFDFGYAYGTPEGLTIWEAQFGDFNNGAQIIIDQFLSAGEDKWNAPNGLTLFLPHGYEGMGSEHSSGRMERYLQLCAGDNMQVANPTTPANHFHLLRRQVLRPFRKPLVVFTPKKLLRYPDAISTMAELAEGKFQAVIDDPQRAGSSAESVKNVVLCSGKFYYDLLEERKRRVQAGEMDSLALVRLEQLYPFPNAELGAVLDRYEGATLCWAQEEPSNMGAYAHLHRFGPGVKQFFARPESASPAAGSPVVHAERHNAVINSVFGLG